MTQLRYYLTICKIDSQEVVYENAFWTIEGVIEEQEDWDTDQYEFDVETLECETAE